MCQKDRDDDIFQCDQLNKQLQARQLPGTFVGINHFGRIWWQPARINHIPVVFVFAVFCSLQFHCRSAFQSEVVLKLPKKHRWDFGIIFCQVAVSATPILVSPGL